ncbi:hypothetical protein KIH23_10040 [Flavobacterium sp. CYK-55]|uniref:hypothetical protein n=1 Tax=Flavobacterium sp. CYK-55 TaxID=2835529 RepID=UPI001BD052E5|nr:hypothetical protein [Flavobacterium sp. CYK-55]MBS7787637.1 hypothetical protein [Flavobacterium sp. CYK-55]
MRKYILLTSLLLSICCYSQFSDYNNTIGFACGGAGSSTPIIKKTYSLLNTKKYSKFIEMLYSKNSAENFLGVVVSEILKKKKLIVLSQKDLNRISELYNSDTEVEFCSGCSDFGFEKISKMLNQTDKAKMREEAEIEINSIFKK